MSIILHGIAIKPVKKGPMQTVDEGHITEHGLDGNYYGNLRNFLRSKRQVTVLSLEQWQEALSEIKHFAPWYLRRANLCLTGHAFSQQDVGRTLLIGRRVLLEITGETDPCKRMDEIFPGLQGALRPSFRGGVTCRVTNPGDISIEDTVHMI